MVQYKLEWLYKNGNLHSTYANTVEIAEEKAQTFIKDNNIILVTITKCQLIKVLKDIN